MYLNGLLGDTEGVMKVLEVDEPLALPSPIRHRSVNDRHVYLAMKIPTWVVVDYLESLLMDSLILGNTIRQAVKEACQTIPNLTQEEGLHRVKLLIRKLYDRDFYNSLYDQVNEEVETVQRVQLQLTNRCNLRCIHCYMDSGITHYDEIGIENWKSLIDTIAVRADRWFCSISGGEAMLYKDYLEVLTYAKQKGAETAMISNGLMLTEERIRTLEPVLDHIQISLDGATPEVNDAIRGKGVHAAVVKALKLLNNSSIRVGLNVVLMESNVEDIKQNLSRLIQQELDGMKLDLDISTLVREGRANNSDKVITTSNFISSINETAEDFLQMDDWMPSPSYRRQNCGYGNTLAIYSNGDVSPCLSPRFIRGNILKNDMGELLDVIARERTDSLVDRLPECKSFRKKITF